MPKNKKPATNKKEGKRSTSASSRSGEKSTRVGDVRESTGVAIGTNAKAIVIQIRSLLDFRNLYVFGKDHWLFIVVTVLFLSLATASWLHFKDRFLISVSTLISGLFLLGACLLFIYLFIQKVKQKASFFILSVIFFLGLAGLIINEYNRVIHPIGFDTNTFGIAIAYFGEGPNFRKTPLSGEISDSVFRRMDHQVNENLELSKFVDIKQIGVIETREEAIEEGQRIGADLVIWGQLQNNEEVASISFEVLESDYVSNPNFPRIIPLLKRSISDTLFIPGKSSEEIAGATTTISGFAFGMAHLFKWDFLLSQNAFHEAEASSRLHSASDLYLLYFYYGLSLQWSGDLELANKKFEIASEILPNDPAAYLALAYGNRSLGDHELATTQAEKAYELINQYMRQHPDNAYGYYDRALANVIFEDWNLALTDYQSAVRIDPDFYVALIGIVRTYLEMDRFPEAIEASKDTLKLAETKDISPEWAYLYLADSYAGANDHQQARLNYERAVSFGPHIDWIRYKAGQFFFKDSDYISALEEYETLLEVTSNKAWAYSTLAGFYAEIEVLDKAVANYQEALRYNPADDGIWVALANVYANSEMIEKADDAFKRAIETADRTGNLIYDQSSYGNFLYLQGRHEEATTQWESALLLDPNQCKIMLNLGLAYEQLEQTEKARDIYLTAQAVNETDNVECVTDAELRLENLSP